MPVNISHIGVRNLNPASTSSFRISTIVPNTAREILVYAYLACRFSANETMDDIVFYVEHGGVRFEQFYICIVTIRRLTTPTLTTCGSQCLLID